MEAEELMFSKPISEGGSEFNGYAVHIKATLMRALTLDDVHMVYFYRYRTG